MNKLCLCGCGKETKYNIETKCYNNWIHGHNKAMLGKNQSEKSKLLMSVSKVGKTPWNKGKSPSEETKRKISNTLMGIPLSEERKRYMSLSAKNSVNSGRFQKGQPPPHGAGTGKHSICNAGYEVRSSYERSFSDGMCALNMNHSYESQRFYFGRYSYLPDYFIPELNLYIELKGHMKSKDVIQHRMFIKAGYHLIVLDKKFFQRDRLFERVLVEMAAAIAAFAGGTSNTANVANKLDQIAKQTQATTQPGGKVILPKITAIRR